MNKKPYTTPRLTVHGDVEKITLQNGLDNADTLVELTTQLS